MDKENRYIWIPLIELAVLAFTTLGTTITLYMHTENKMEENRREIMTAMTSFHKEIRDEMKDFHGRLCAIEERNRKN